MRTRVFQRRGFGHSASVRRSWSALALLAWPWAALAWTAGLEFQVRPEAAQVRLGDRVRVSLHSSDPSLDPRRIVGVESEPDTERWHLAQPWAPAPRKKKEKDAGLWSAALQCFDTGEVALPKTRIAYRLADGTLAEAEATTTTLKVTSALNPRAAIAQTGAAPGPASEGAPVIDLIGPKPLYPFPIHWLPIVLACAAGLALLVAGGLLLRRRLARRRRARPGAPPAPPLPPGVWALREIERRRGLPVCEHGPLREIASLASEVVRVYVSRRYGFQALDMTSYECLHALRARAVDSRTLALAQRFLADCDLAKFSKYELPGERWTGLWDDARDFVRATTPEEEFHPAPGARRRAGAAAS